MKAIFVREHGGPEVLKLEDVPDPKPSADQVVVRLRAVGVNPVDVYIRTGAYARKPALPFIPGSDGGSDEGLKSVRESGADAVFNHTMPGYLDEIMKATGGRGVDVVLEMAAHVNLDKDLGLLANRGRVVVIGNRGRVEIDARQAMGKDASILGMTLFNISDADMASINSYMMAGLANGTLKPVVGREFPLADAAKAQDAVMASGARGKIGLIP